MSENQLVYQPITVVNETESGRVILRDGTTAELRPARPTDRIAVQRFIERLLPQSDGNRALALLGLGVDPSASLCGLTGPHLDASLLIVRLADDQPRALAAGWYVGATKGETADFGVAVDDSLHGKGLGTMMLERLAVLAVHQGFRRFRTLSPPDNAPLMDVLRSSGFELNEHLENGKLEVDLSLVPTEQSVTGAEMRDRVATAASLRPFFRPNGVAVVGASRTPTSIGYRILEALVLNRFVGPVYPVNPRASVVGCIRAYPSVRNLPEPVDLAVIAVPRDAVAGVVDDCAARGVRALVVITAGFAEAKDDGREVQQRLAEQVRGHGMRMIGPNCLGLLNASPTVRLNASFSPVFPPSGRVAMSSQSGALGLAVLAAAQRLGLGLSTFVSIGNKADVSSNDLLQYWDDDPETNVILLYLESFGNPRRFSRIARRVARRKPIIAVKSGRSQSGRRAAGSHTAALSASDVAVDALFHQTGVIRAETLEEMFDVAALLSGQPLPPGRRVAIVTNAGGLGILCADGCEAASLTVAELSAETRQRLATFLPTTAGLSNPVDMIASASPDQYRRAVETVLGAAEVDAVIVIYISVGLAQPGAMTDAVKEGVRLARAGAGTGKPVLTCFMPAGESSEKSAGEDHFPRYEFPEAAARALGKAAAYAEWRSQPPGLVREFEGADLGAARTICLKALAQRGAGWLTAQESDGVLRAAGLPLVKGGVARTPEEAVEVARRTGFPVAVKLVSTRLVHKTEVGGVRLGLKDEAAVRKAFVEIRQALAAKNEADAMDGVLVQEMISDGIEVMIGMTHDPSFGPLVAFGLGGINVEILGDVNFRVTPLTDRDAAEMVRSIRGHRLLEGYRGHPPADIPALEECLLRISSLVETVPEMSELDLNPVIALPPGQGCRLVDARIRIRIAPTDHRS